MSSALPAAPSWETSGCRAIVVGAQRLVEAEQRERAAAWGADGNAWRAATALNSGSPRALPAPIATTAGSIYPKPRFTPPPPPFHDLSGSPSSPAASPYPQRTTEPERAPELLVPFTVSGVLCRQEGNHDGWTLHDLKGSAAATLRPTADAAEGPAAPRTAPPESGEIERGAVAAAPPEPDAIATKAAARHLRVRPKTLFTFCEEAIATGAAYRVGTGGERTHVRWLVDGLDEWWSVRAVPRTRTSARAKDKDTAPR